MAVLTQEEMKRGSEILQETYKGKASCGGDGESLTAHEPKGPSESRSRYKSRSRKQAFIERLIILLTT